MKNHSNIHAFAKTFFSRGPVVYASIALILLLVCCAAFSPMLTKYDPNEIDLSVSLKEPCLEHPFGCDFHGRDVLTRVLYGAQISLLCGIFSCVLGAIVGMLLGLLAGYSNGIVRAVIMRYVDLQISIPPLLFNIVLGLIFGHSLWGLVIAISFGLLPNFIRLMYSLVLSIRESDYIKALHFAGIKSWKIILKHLLPNTFPSMIVMFTMNLGTAIMLESTLSFLGIGIQQPTASWGNMVSDGYNYIFNRPFLAFAPGICIALTVIAFNIVGDSLRDALDPRLKGKL